MHYRIIPVTPFQQNCTLFWCEKTRHTAIIDPGGDSQKVIGKINAIELIPECILLTHGHLDHAGGANELAQRLQIPIIGPHREDAFLLDNMDQQAAMLGFGDAIACKPDRWLKQGEEVPVGEECLEVYRCPGHTPGHIIFFHRNDQLAQVGDVLFSGSIGRTDFPRGDQSALIHSIRDQLWPLGDEVRFVPGHGPESTFGEERRTNPFVGDSR
ncbi:MAG: MBL fold metallo-hydrolase [Candidatus Thiodiazotropha sp. (ex Lucinoma aequizonata)]|nr:MBL fold metallo-hydrolase [Candidatus Thiodiazotropha sp. (ex Lucinoma aequizonata)]MCU7889744.1 MBL fold metallo-hydrolase [Candidatus Thiodiazotropha sp. (ex Lucinoma aequizonata)]MCU7896846.1 MBL fold metallo-hydrolase [Candidatus Thiodiazotropha sp. (ex Lucinoma aequizonata)]MCU7898127.1 MBL fold metallo-hydrolase [Candidatus Thiodiazotropha sp. (ex Lucinoma aequizonata)]MCU7903098.1 MBL fold metallo-hydrolase [Candidatus Thiodiazotropha sp. (ex Lucinoma aequizonata)]